MHRYIHEEAKFLVQKMFLEVPHKSTNWLAFILKWKKKKHQGINTNERNDENASISIWPTKITTNPKNSNYTQFKKD